LTSSPEKKTVQRPPLHPPNYPATTATASSHACRSTREEDWKMGTKVLLVPCWASRSLMRRWTWVKVLASDLRLGPNVDEGFDSTRDFLWMSWTFTANRPVEFGTYMYRCRPLYIPDN
jgi:hypothetical protein